jgi:hypothetical protein
MTGILDIQEISREREQVALAAEDLAGFVADRACPECQPGLFDADLVRVPAARFCAAHEGGRLAWIYKQLQGKGKL